MQWVPYMKILYDNDIYHFKLSIYRNVGIYTLTNVQGKAMFVPPLKWNKTNPETKQKYDNNIKQYVGCSGQALLWSHGMTYGCLLC